MSDVVNDRYEDSRDISLLAIDQYVREVAWIQADFLTPERHQKLLSQVRRSLADPSNAWLASVARHARDELIEAYQPLVLRVARLFFRRGRAAGYELGDLINEGNVGLVRRFDEFVRFGGHFNVFVYLVVSREISRTLYCYAGLVSVSSGERSLLYRMRTLRKKLESELRRTPSHDELAQALGVSRSRLYELLACQAAEEVRSVQKMAAVFEGKEDRFLFTPISESSCLSHDERTICSEELQRILEEKLTPVQCEILRLLCRFDDGGSRCRYQYEIAELLGMDQANVQYHLRQVSRRLGPFLAVTYQGGKRAYRFYDAWEEEYYTCLEAARLLGLPTTTFQRRIADGAIACTLAHRGRFVRYSKRDIDALVVRSQDIYTTKEVAVLLGVNPHTVVNYVRSGMLPAEQIPGKASWHFLKQDIDAFVARRQEVSA